MFTPKPLLIGRCANGSSKFSLRERSLWSFPPLNRGVGQAGFRWRVAQARFLLITSEDLVARSCTMVDLMLFHGRCSLILFRRTKGNLARAVCSVFNSSVDQTDSAIRFYPCNKLLRLRVCINYTLLFRQSSLKPFTCYSIWIVIPFSFFHSSKLCIIFK